MARVPSSSNLSNVQRSLITQPGGTTRAIPRAFGADIGRAQAEAGAGLQQSAQQLADIAIEMQKESNLREMKEADNAQGEMEHTLWSGDGTAENPGLGNLEGQAALDAQIETERVRLERMKEIEKGLSSDYLRDKFSLMSAQRSSAARARSSDHITKQSKVANARVAEVRVASAVRDAASDYNNEVRMNDHFAVAQAEAINAAMNRGIVKQELLDAAAEGATSQVARAAIEAAIANDDVAQAKELLKTYTTGKLIFGDDLVDMKKALKGGTARVDAQGVQDQAILLFPDDPDKRSAYMRENLTGEARDRGVSMMTTYNAEQARATARAITEAGQNAANHVRQGGSVATIPEADQEFLTPDKLRSLRINQGLVASERPPNTNWKYYDKIPWDNDAALAGIDLDDAENYLATTEFNSLVSEVRRAKAGREKGPGEERVFTPTQVFNKAVLDTDFAPSKRESSEKKKRRGKLFSLYMATIQTMERNNGPKKKLTVVEEQEVLQQLIDDVVIGDMRIAIPVFGQFIEDVEPLFTTEVPPEERERLTQELTAAGRPVTELTIRQQFFGIDPSPLSTSTGKPIPARPTVTISASDRKLVVEALEAEGLPVTEDSVQQRYQLVTGGQ